MVLIPFQHSVKYITAQIAPYLLLTFATVHVALHFGGYWRLIFVILALISAWRLLELSSVSYFFTRDLLIISRGVVCKDIQYRALCQLKGIEVRRNRLLCRLHVAHLFCGLEGPPAGRIRLTGMDDETMHRALRLMIEGI
ncbi:MAG: hypothetical protein JKY70_04935 [Mucilaginibacter sp.]|nr:hypothetical protein [Mucilaginibacter sp.]